MVTCRCRYLADQVFDHPLPQLKQFVMLTLWPDMGHNITESQGSLFVARCHYFCFFVYV